MRPGRSWAPDTLAEEHGAILAADQTAPELRAGDRRQARSRLDGCRAAHVYRRPVQRGGFTCRRWRLSHERSQEAQDDCHGGDPFGDVCHQLLPAKHALMAARESGWIWFGSGLGRVNEGSLV